MSTNSPSSKVSTMADIGSNSVLEGYIWNWQGQQLRVVYEKSGRGKPVLLLPAFSTVSSRSEMWELAKLLAPQFETITLDWPGFGESERPALDYRPPVYRQFLEDFVTEVLQTPVAVVAAGHACGYVMQLANARPEVFSHIVLSAPTWRGPLPTMAGKQEDWFGIIREAVRSPIFGDILYSLNTAPPFLSYMYQSHVFSDPAILTPNFIDRKWKITQQPGAKYAPVAFVTGALDPQQNRAEFLQLFESVSVPVMVAIGEQVPKRSKEEMELLTQYPSIQTRKLPGALGLHEEFPEKLAEVILPFLTA